MQSCAGDRKRRDVAIVISYIAALDCYVTVSQKGALSVWTTKKVYQSIINTWL